MEAILLITTVPSNLEIEKNQRRMLQVLESKHISITTVDGANAANKELRSKLFEVSGKRAVYPQLFRHDTATGVYTFLGDWEAVSLANEDKDRGALDSMLEGLRKK